MSLALRDGWDDDVDVDDEDINVGEDIASPPPRSNSFGADHNSNNAWGDDDDLNFDDDQDEEDDDDHSNNDHVSHDDVFDEDNGWNDDDLQFDDDDDTNNNNVRTSANCSTGEHFPASPVEAEALAASTGIDNTAMDSSRKHTRMYQELKAYILSLEHLSGSINALLGAEYNNNPDKAAELCAYYAERPGLVQYTIEKELPRMEYVLQDGPSGAIITDKQEIAQSLLTMQQQNALLPRCANQSMLADLLQVFTGPDLLVRPQYLATAIADACRFYLDLARGLVQVQSHLVLSIPTERGRWEVAQIFVSLVFVPSQPYIEYRLERVVVKSTPETDPLWEEYLESALQLIEFIHPEEEISFVDSEASGMNFRDAFLQQSQNLLQNSREGMHSALKEFEQVFGFRNKLNVLPGFLPDDVLHAAATEEPSSLPQERPTSILGGFVRKGFSRLAKKVALPEEDPMLYRDWSRDQQRSLEQGQQEQQQQQAPPGPQLYSRVQGDSTPPVQAMNAYRQQQPSAPAENPPSMQPPRHNHQQTVAPEELHKHDHSKVVSPPQQDDIKMPPLVSVLSHDSEEYGGSDHGWGDDLDIGDDDDDDLDDDAQSLDKVAVASTPKDIPPQPKDSGDSHAVSALNQARKEKFLVDEQRIPGDWAYDPSTDIVPTRRRWLNPHPGTRDLKLIEKS